MNALTVSELTTSIKKNLESGFRGVLVQGEISNCKKHSSGHIYFSLKDKNAQISAVLFRGQAAKILRTPKDGDHVTLFGDISVYPPRGAYQIIAKDLQFIGIGELLIKLQELKEILLKKGYFDPAKKKKLPVLPKRIGIVTSPTGAVIQDVLNVLKRRFSGFHLVLNPVKVQGPGAAEEIAQAIHEFNRYDLADVLIVGRGGGSLEDLWAFNEEIVANAVFASNIPIVSAVGHETDHTICDLVSDIRAPTPSAAAEIVIQEKAQLIEFLKNAKARSATYLERKVQELKKNLRLIKNHPHFTSSHALLGRWMQELDEKRSSLDIWIKHNLEKKRQEVLGMQRAKESWNPAKQIPEMRQRVKNYRARLDECLKNQMSVRKERLTNLFSHLKSLDPKNLLQKGYSILFSEKKDSIILSAKDVRANEPIKAIVKDGRIHANVTYVREKS